MVSHNVPRATQARTPEQRQQELEKIRKYQELEQKMRQKMTTSKYDDETFRLSSKLLRLNPEYYTIWNVRRICFDSSVLPQEPCGDGSNKGEQENGELETAAHGKSARVDEDLFRSELAFTIPLLMEFPKCYWIWKYRLWILQRAIERLPVTAARAIWEDELGLVGKMLHKDRRNFHAWGYRRHVVSELESTSLEGKSMVEAEFLYTTRMIHMDLSNFSAWHNRSQLIPRLLDERNADTASRRAFLDEELAMVHDALNVGPEDQSLWYYHQSLVHSISGATRHGPIVRVLSVEERRQYLQREVDFMQDLVEDYSDVKWIYQALVQCTLAVDPLRNHEPKEADRQLLGQWLQRLRELDTQRRGRWDELQQHIGIASPSVDFGRYLAD